MPVPEDVFDASSRVRPWIRRTPLLENATLNAMCGRRVLLKAEHLQHTGAYKVRGATNNIRALSEQLGSALRGVVAASSGNHGQAVAWAARRAGIGATIVLPSNAVGSKRAAIEGYGAIIHTVGTDPEELAPAAAAIARERGLVEVQAYDHPLTIAGQGTCVLEALGAQGAAVDTVVVPIGGGGLAAGSVLAARALDAPVEIVAVEPAAADDTLRSVRAGRRLRIPSPDTIADALRARQPGEITFGINQTGLRTVVTVADHEIATAMRVMAERAKQIVEPSGAASVAALLSGRVPGDGPVLAVVTGGNADLDTLSSVWRRAAQR